MPALSAFDVLVLVWLGGLTVAVALLVRRANSLKARQRRHARRHSFKDTVAAPQVAEALRLNPPGPTTLPPLHTAPYGEDAWLWEVLRPDLPSPTTPKGKPRRFVECGAYDGRTFSHTWLFESAGWTGVLIEPIEHHAEQCRRNRPACRVVHSAVAGPDAPPTATFAVTEGDAHTDVASHLAAGSGVGEVQTRHGRNTVEVPLTTLTEAIGRDNAPIELLVLDVEGAEVEALTGLDLDHFQPRAIFLEDHTAGRDTRAADLLAQHGYTRAATYRYNVLFVRTDDHEAIARATRFPVAPMELE